MDLNILTEAFKLKPAQAIAFMRAKGYAFSWNWYDTWKESHNQAFTVAKVMRADILQDIRGMVDKALEEGLTYQQFAKELEPKLQDKGWWGKQKITDETGAEKEVQLGSPRRLRTIYETNTQMSYSAGRWKGQIASVKYRPYGQYLSVIDKSTTKRCRSLNGLILPLTDPFWKKFYPPNHWGCRATVRTVSQREMDSDNLVLASSEGRMIEKQVEIGGQNVAVSGFKINDNETYWCDPGFDYNPGVSSYNTDLSKYDKDILKQLQQSRRA